MNVNKKALLVPLPNEEVPTKLYTWKFDWTTRKTRQMRDYRCKAPDGPQTMSGCEKHLKINGTSCNYCFKTVSHCFRTKAKNPFIVRSLLCNPAQGLHGSTTMHFISWYHKGIPQKLRYTVNKVLLTSPTKNMSAGSLLLTLNHRSDGLWSIWQGSFLCFFFF